MIIALSGTPGSGKSTVGKMLAKRFRCPHYSTGDLMRELAKQRGITIEAMQRIAEKDKSIDAQVDAYTIKLGKSKKSFVIDSRIAWHFLPQAVKIYLDVELETGARRIAMDNKATRSTQQKAKTLKESVALLKKRIASEAKRYKKLYGVTLRNPRNYDIIIDTTDMSPKEVYQSITSIMRGS